MPITAQDISVLHTYAEGVMQRADHHAGKVKGAALAILGGIIWRGDPGSIKIRQYAGSPANMLWVSIGGNVYVIKYDHDAMQIQICDRTQSGAVLHRLDDSTPVSAVEAIFRAP